jgi:hypothetical protein
MPPASPGASLSMSRWIRSWRWTVNRMSAGRASVLRRRRCPRLEQQLANQRQHRRVFRRCRPMQPLGGSGEYHPAPPRRGPVSSHRRNRCAKRRRAPRHPSQNTDRSQPSWSRSHRCLYETRESHVIAESIQLIDGFRSKWSGRNRSAVYVGPEHLIGNDLNAL